MSDDERVHVAELVCVVQGSTRRIPLSALPMEAPAADEALYTAQLTPRFNLGVNGRESAGFASPPLCAASPHRHRHCHCHWCPRRNLKSLLRIAAVSSPGPNRKISSLTYGRTRVTASLIPQSTVPQFHTIATLSLSECSSG